VSLDRNIIIHDLFSNKQYFHETLPESIDCCVINPTYDTVYCGSASGKIYIVDLSMNSYTISTLHTKNQLTNNISTSNNSYIHNNTLIGHDKSISSLAISSDNYTLVSASHDGSIKIWNTVSRQCIHEIIPFNKNPLSNIKVISYIIILLYYINYCLFVACL
jgi:WD40 repeat protein